MAVIKIERTVELTGPILTEGLNGTLFTTEGQAHQFTIHCTQSGTAVTLTGTVSAKFMREESNSTILISGSLLNGAAVVTLPADCYHRSGRFSLTIFVTASSVTTCIYSATGSVKAAQAGTLVDEGTEVPDLDTILAMINSKVSKSGDTMTGDLSTTKLTVKRSTYPTLAFNDSSNTNLGYIMVDHTTRRVYLRSTMSDAEHYDSFCLPLPDLTRTSNKFWDILTTKTPVTIAQGGTGAATAAAALANLGLTYKAGDSIVGAFRIIGRAVNAGDGIYGVLTLDRPITASSISFSDLGAANLYTTEGAKTLTGLTVVSFSRNQIYLTASFSGATITGGALGYVEINSMKIAFA